MKNTAKEGDLLCITGDIGLAALGFNLNEDNIYTDKSLNPLARLMEGKIIKDAGATSATDITDGLASELYEMKKDSLGFMIHEDKLEISDEFKEISSKLGLDYMDLILHVGEDFELVFTIDNVDDLGIDFKVIGEVNNSNKIQITLSNGEVKEIENRGYNHYVS
jgi:thiamine-monophosphate kinase